MLTEILNEINTKLIKNLNNLKIEYSKISANKANISLLNNIKVKYYEEIYNLEQLCVINIENGNSINIKPFDKKNIHAITKEIINLKLDLNPFINGDTIKVIFPKMTLERRELFVKKIKKISEDTKIATRNIRRIFIQKVKTILKEKQISQDEEKKYSLKIDETITKHIKHIDELTEKKIKEILTI